MVTIVDRPELEINDSFYCEIAALISPKDYKNEMKLAKKLLNYFITELPILNKNQWEQYILKSYYLNPSPIPFYSRLEYINALLFSENYENQIEDITEEHRKRLLDYRKITGKKPTKYLKLAMSQITTNQYIDQIESLENAPTFTYFLQ